MSKYPTVDTTKISYSRYYWYLCQVWLAWIMFLNTKLVYVKLKHFVMIEGIVYNEIFSC
jgi:hypothetical protein